MRKYLLVLSSIALLVTVGCAGQRARGPIPDTPDGRAILELLETYRTAMQAQDVETILSIASTDYYDPMGTPDPNNDVYYDDLEEKLAGDLDQILRIRLDIEVLKMDFEDVEPLAEVSYRYDVRYQISMPSGDKWHNALDVNRMVLRQEADGAWRVVSGL